MTHNHRTWCEIDLNALEHNYAQYRKLASDNVKIMAVVKADAYGHGVVHCAKRLEQNGVDYFAVAFIDEAMEIREAGIKTPILILGYTDRFSLSDAVKNDITVTIFDVEDAVALSKEAQTLGKTAKVHIKIDTGMSRIGFYGDAQKIAKSIAEINTLPFIELEGIFTHFAKADEEERDFTHVQFERFLKVIRCSEDFGVSFKIRHCCNSAAAMLYPEMHLDMIRAGIALYGCYPSKLEYPLELKPVMTFKSRVINVKTVNDGETVSYGGVYRANGSVKLATVAAGYADGYNRCLSDKARVLVKDSFSKVAGRICMDQCMIDVTNVNNISVGDEVVLFGTKDGLKLPVEELADTVGTISYEILCNIAKRVPRIPR